MTTPSNSFKSPQAVLTGTCKLTAANTNYDTPTASVQLLAAQTDGARITKVTAVPAADCTATDVQLYAYDGTNYRHIKTVALSAQTISSGHITAIPGVDFGFSDFNPLFLSSAESLKAAIGVAQTAVHVRAEGGAY